MQGIQFESISVLKTHWQAQCEAIKLRCSLCEAFLTRPEIAAHKCDAGLISLVKRLKQRIKELEEENALLKGQG